MLVCADCFGDPLLKKRVDELVASSNDGECALHPAHPGVEMSLVAEIIDDVFRSNYTWGHYDNRTDDFFGDDLRTIVVELAEIEDDEVADALVEALVDGDNFWPADGEEGFYREDASFVKSLDGFESHSRLWDQFRESIVHGQRFFNDQAKTLLTGLFADLQLQRDEDLTSPIYMVRPGDLRSKFFRARIANDPGDRENFAKDIALNLGPPPARKRRPGRMNPSGIVAFYGGFDMDTCIAELRPPVGSVVAGAEFEILRPMMVLDTTKFAGPPKELNMFAAHHSERMAQWRFMQRFMKEIAQPYSPDDEHLDYIPTQAVADYLVNHHRFQFDGETVRIEAILYRSAQNRDGINIAILGEAGVVVRGRPKPTPGRRAGTGGAFDDVTSELPRHPFATETGRLRALPDSYAEYQVDTVRFEKVKFYDRWDDF